MCFSCEPKQSRTEGLGSATCCTVAAAVAVIDSTACLALSLPWPCCAVFAVLCCTILCCATLCFASLPCFTLQPPSLVTPPISPSGRESPCNMQVCVQCIVLHRIVLRCVVLYCVVLYCTVLYCTVLYLLAHASLRAGLAWHGMAWQDVCSAMENKDGFFKSNPVNPVNPVHVQSIPNPLLIACPMAFRKHLQDLHECIGLDWTGLDWNALECTGMHWNALECTGMDSHEWNGLHCTALCTESTKSNPTHVSYTQWYLPSIHFPSNRSILDLLSVHLLAVPRPTTLLL